MAVSKLALAIAHDLGVYETMLADVQLAIRVALTQTNGPATADVLSRIRTELVNGLDMIENVSKLLEVPTLH